MKINWEKIKKDFEKITYYSFSEEIERKKLKFLLNDEDKQCLKLNQLNTWDYPLERQNPNIIKILLNLNSRLLIAETSLKKKIEKLEQDLENLKGIFVCDKEAEEPDGFGNGSFKDLEVYYEEANKKEEIKKEEVKAENSLPPQ